ncbi:MAG: sigma-70 family RNA polymerase sigma factor [Patescibacteria group bacterium]
MTQEKNQTSDLILIREAQAGQSEAFGKIYDLYIKKIYDFIYYKTLHKNTAEDIVSEVFLKAWKNINQFKDGSFSAWLYAIARNAIIDNYRKQQDLIDIDDCWDLADGQDFLNKIDENLKIEKIKQAMSSLKASDRELIIMRLWLDMSFKDIAEQTGKTEGAVKMSFGRALVSLKNKIPLALIILWPELIKIWK